MPFSSSFRPALLGLLCATTLLVSCGGTGATLAPTTVLPAADEPATAIYQEGSPELPAVATSSTTAPAAGHEQTVVANREIMALAITPAAATPVTITIVYDNIAYRPELITNWGFAAVITYGDHTLLFDTGGDSPTLLSNIATLQIDPMSIDHVVLSHEHGDHTGGLQGLLDTGIHPTVHMPPSFAGSFKQQVAGRATVVETTAGAQVMEGVFVTGEILRNLPEQALVVMTGQGLVIITGCAHPGVSHMVAQAMSLFDQPVYLVLGGFHLGDASQSAIAQILADLREMGVQKVAPSHCTGEQGFAMFATEYGEDFIEAGIGRVIVVQP